MDEQQIKQARRLCFFAHYDQDNIVAEHVLGYLAALRAAGFTIVVLSTAALPDAECEKVRSLGTYILLRANTGLDFGGWIDACSRFFPIAAELLLLANDSVYGPLTDLSAFIDELTSTDADFYGAVESVEVAPHLQSWFLLFRPAAYRSAAFAGIMCRPMQPMKSKGDLVASYEVGLSQRLAAAGLRHRAAFSLAPRSGIVRSYPYNPAHLLWRDAIAEGVPFLKIELMRLNPVRVMDIDDWADVVAARAPRLVPLIVADMARRGTRQPPGYVMMTRAPPVYWPEVRKLVLADYRAGRNGEKRGHRAYFYAFWLVLAAVRIPRRLHARLTSLAY